MNLEEIKDSQMGINNTLLHILDRIETTVVKITGEYREPPLDSKENLHVDRGILGELQLLQYSTNNISSRIEEAVIRLNAHTYSPVLECSPR